MDDTRIKFIKGLKKWLSSQDNNTYTYLAQMIEAHPSYVTKIMTIGCGDKAMERIADKLGFSNYWKIIELGEEHTEGDQTAGRQKEVIDINGAGHVLNLDQYVVDSSLSPALQEAVDQLKTIYKSGDDVIIRAITENLKAFVQAVDYRLQVKDLKTEVRSLRAESNTTKGEIKSLKEQLSYFIESIDGKKQKRSS